MSVILHTTYGDLLFDLYYLECPKASFNFLALCASGYYNDSPFLKCIPKVLIQGGDPTETGKGGASIFGLRQTLESVAASDDTSAKPEASPKVNPGYFEDEGFGVTSHCKRGILSMAHKGTTPGTNASQFFILFAPQPQLDGVYTAFGELRLPQGDDAEGSSPTAADDPRQVEDAEMRRETLHVLQDMENVAVTDKGKIIHEGPGLRIVDCTVVFNPFAEGLIRLDV